MRVNGVDYLERDTPADGSCWLWSVGESDLRGARRGVSQLLHETPELFIESTLEDKEVRIFHSSEYMRNQGKRLTHSPKDPGDSAGGDCRAGPENPKQPVLF